MQCVETHRDFVLHAIPVKAQQNFIPPTRVDDPSLIHQNCARARDAESASFDSVLTLTRQPSVGKFEGHWDKEAVR